MKLSHAALAVLALLAGSPQAHAMKAMVLEGGRVGNGGGLVVCRDPANGSIKSVELLDLYEAKKLRNMKLELNQFSGTWQKQVQAMIQRFAARSPMRVELYGDWLKRLSGEIAFLTDVEFSKVPDSGHVGVPRGCEFEQGAIQMAPRFAGEKRYFVNDELWQAMSETQKAALIFHELIYREAIGYGHQDSISVRYLTGFLLSDQIHRIQEAEFLEMLQSARFELSDALLEDQRLAVPDEVQMNFQEIWSAAPGEQALILTLKNRFPVLLGKCKGDGCQSFESYQIRFSPDLELVRSLQFHSTATQIRFGDVTFETVDMHSKIPHADILFLKDQIMAVSYRIAGTPESIGKVPFHFTEKSAVAGETEGMVTSFGIFKTGGEEYRTVQALTFAHPRMRGANGLRHCTPVFVVYDRNSINISEPKGTERSYRDYPCEGEPYEEEFELSSSNGSKISVLIPSTVLDPEKSLLEMDEIDGRFEAKGTITKMRLGETVYEGLGSQKPIADSFAENGNSESDHYQFDLKAPVVVSRGAFRIAIGPGTVRAWSSGIPKQATLAMNTKLITANTGQEILLASGVSVKLDQEGRLLNFQ